MTKTKTKKPTVEIKRMKDGTEYIGFPVCPVCSAKLAIIDYPKELSRQPQIYRIRYLQKFFEKVLRLHIKQFHSTK